MPLTATAVPFQNWRSPQTTNIRLHVETLGFKAFTQHKKLCIVDAIATYLELTSKLRSRLDQSKLLFAIRDFSALRLGPRSPDGSGTLCQTLALVKTYLPPTQSDRLPPQRLLQKVWPGSK